MWRIPYFCFVCATSFFWRWRTRLLKKNVTSFDPSNEEDVSVQLPALYTTALANRFRLTLIGRIFHLGGRSTEAFLCRLLESGISKEESVGMTWEMEGFISNSKPNRISKRSWERDHAISTNGPSPWTDGSSTYRHTSWVGFILGKDSWTPLELLGGRSIPWHRRCSGRRHWGGCHGGKGASLCWCDKTSQV